MHLIYINFVGINFRGMNIYEFLFTVSDIGVVLGEDWDAYPANGSPKPPKDYVDAAYKLETHMELDLIQNDESFDMADCMHGIIALAWENDKEYDNDNYLKRLFFSYGENVETVKDKIYERDIHLENIFENAKTRQLNS